MNRLVIDTDPGVDDAHAIMMAFAHPDAHVEAITTGAGNASLERTTANACTILDVLERDVPVYAGCGRALVAKDTPDGSDAFGQDGLGDSDYPPSKRKVADEHAVHALVRLANAFPGELTLVALGPLTNIALATRLDPALPTKFNRLVVVGGSIRGTGISTPAAEFNVYSDPEATAMVFDAWPGLTLVSWDTILEHPLTAEQVETLMAIDSPRAEFFRRITPQFVERIYQFVGRRVMPTGDSLGMAVALEPGIVRVAEAHDVQVELAGQHTRGHTAVDWFDITGQKPNVNLVLEVDMERFWELMQTVVR
jgi:purine nucleosidase